MQEALCVFHFSFIFITYYYPSFFLCSRPDKPCRVRAEAESIRIFFFCLSIFQHSLFVSPEMERQSHRQDFCELLSRVFQLWGLKRSSGIGWCFVRLSKAKRKEEKPKEREQEEDGGTGRGGCSAEEKITGRALGRTRRTRRNKIRRRKEKIYCIRMQRDGGNAGQETREYRGTRFSPVKPKEKFLFSPFRRVQDIFIFIVNGRGSLFSCHPLAQPPSLRRLTT